MDHDARTDTPHVPGHELLEPLGTGASATVWRGGRGTEVVAVKVVAPGPDADRELAVLRAVDDPHVVGLRDAVALADGRLALVTDLLDGGTLAGVVAARGRLRPGEVVTVLVPLARALAALHAQGIQHGDVAPGNVLFSGDGRPSLADLGTTRVTGVAREEVYGTAGYVDPAVLTGGAASPSSDVYGLGALGWLALTGAAPPAPPCRPALRDLVPGAPEALVDAVESAVDPRPDERPSPLELARAVHAAALAEPVWRPGGAPSDGGLTRRVGDLRRAAAGPPRHRRGRPVRSRRGWAGALAVALAALALTGGGLAVASGRERTVAAVPATGELTDVEAATAVVVRLARLRAEALADPRAGAPTGAATGSPAARADAEALARLRRTGSRYVGLRLSPHVVRVLQHGPGAASVLVRVDASAYDVRVRGRVVRRVPAARGALCRLDLARRPGSGWAVAQVRDA